MAFLHKTERLADGVAIPWLGLGLSHNGGGFSSPAAEAALEMGCRLFDTAQRYNNEEELGNVIAQAGVTDAFVTSKVWPGNYHSVTQSCLESKDRLKLDSIDLMLMHWPDCGESSLEANKRRRAEVWRDMEGLLDAGHVKAIGVSNFEVSHLESLLDAGECSMPPQINQCEFNPMQQQRHLLAFCQSRDVLFQGYCPLAKGKALTHPTVLSIAEAHECTPAQVLVRWCLDRGVLCIPKSTKPNRVRGNFAVDNVALGETDMMALNSLDCNLRVTWDPSDVL